MSVVKDSMGRTVLHLAAENNDLEKLEELLKSGDYDVNEQDVRGVPFRVLIHRNHRPLVFSRDTRT
jgi:ankyrin repeat protein